MSSKQKHREDAYLIPNRAGKILSGHADKVEVLSTFFASVFISRAGPQSTGSNSYDNVLTHQQWRKDWSAASCKGSTHTNPWAQKKSTLRYY